jgi:3-O-methylgallate 3,4-dioxygenase
MRRREPGSEFHYPVHSKLALHFIEGLLDDFDVCALKGLTGDQFEGHAYSYIHRTYMQKKKQLPIVPVFLNTYYPPNPIPPRRCVKLGEALGKLIASYPENLRVGLLASGGLSHFVVDEELDRGILDAIKRKDTEWLGARDPKRLQAGSSECRSWITVAAAATSLDLAWSDYVPAYRTPAATGTGLAFARWA